MRKGVLKSVMKKIRCQLIHNIWYWIAGVVTLSAIAPARGELIIGYAIAAGLCSVVVYSLITIRPIREYFRYKAQSVLVLLLGLLYSSIVSVSFYDTWLYSSKLAAVASLLHVTSKAALCLMIPVVVFCSVCSVFVLLSYLLDRYRRSDDASAKYWIILFASVLTFQLAQRITCSKLLSEGVANDLSGILVVAVLITLLSAITANVRIAVPVGTFPFLLFSTVNYFVYLFRGHEICFHDFQSIGTAMNVAGTYEYILPMISVLCWLAWLLFILAFLSAGRENTDNRKRFRGISAAICLASILLVFVLERDTPSKLWENYGTSKNGTIVNLLLQARDSRIKTPENYSPEALEQLEEEYKTDQTVSGNNAPSIIAIMDESFTDFSVLGNDVKTEEPLLPFITSMEENTIRGYAYTSIYGANTANSEFEFLTGNSMAFLPAGSVVYQQYLSEDQYSLLMFLHSVGYHCIATHPYHANGWNRPNVYDWFGFDETSFLPDYPQQNTVRQLVSDQEMFEYVIDLYESRDRGTPFFLFGITMQNHGGYKTKDFASTVRLEYDSQYPMAEQYLTLANLTDQAVEYLIEYFSDVSEPVVILFFGDHQPKVEPEFLEAVHGGALEDLDSEMLKYKVPFFIWANYDIEEQSGVETSVNYLSTWLLEVCGFELPAYNQFLRDAEQVVPILTEPGYYSESSRRFLPVAEAVGEEKEILDRYHILEYNNLFDKEHLSGIFRFDDETAESAR